MIGNASVSRSPLVPDNRVKSAMQGLLHIAIHVEKRFTVDQLAEAAGLPTPTVSAYLSSRADAQRQASLGNALSIAVVLGKPAVNTILSLIGYTGARPVDEADPSCPMQAVASGMQHFAVFAAAAADGVIDHIEEPGATTAVDGLIATLIPYSSTGRAA